MIAPNLNPVLLAASGIFYALLFAILASAMLTSGSQRDRVGPLLPLYGLACFLSTLGQLALALDRTGWMPRDLLARLLLYALIPLALMFLGLTHQFLRVHLVRRGRGWEWVLGLAWLAAVIVIYEDLPASAGATLDSMMPKYSRQWLAFGGLVLGWGAIMAAAAVLTVRAYRRSQQPQHRKRISYWGLALVLTIIAGVLFLVGYRGLGSLAHILGCGTAAFLLMAPNLPKARRLARETLSYLIVTLLMAAVFALAFLSGYLVQQNVALTFAVVLISSLILAAVVYPLLHRLQAILAGTLSRGHRNPDHLVGEYSALIGNIVEMDDLAAVVLGLNREALDVQRGALYILRDRGSSPDLAAETQPSDPPAGRPELAQQVELRVAASTDFSLSPVRFSPESPLAAYLQTEDRPLTQHDLDLQPRFQRMQFAERQWLVELNMDVYVPIHADKQWLGLLALGAKRSGKPYTDEDLNLLVRLASQTATALQNARLFTQLKARSARFERRIEELAEARQSLLRLDAGKSDLMRIAARELQQPLANIQAHIDMLQEMMGLGPLPPKQRKELTATIRTLVQRLEETTRTLRDAAAAGIEPPSLKPQPTPLKPRVEAAAASWAKVLRERRLTLSTVGLEDLPAVEADGSGLQEVLSELIHNSIRFTPNGGQIQVRGHLWDRELPAKDQWVEIVVADTGLGIDRGDLARVTEPFFRRGEVVLDRSVQGRYKAAGPGMGLSRARATVEAHGGRLWIQSPGYDEENLPGTEVHLVLPVCGRADK